MSTFTLTVVDGKEITTTMHNSLADAIETFSENFDPEREFPMTFTGIQAAADAQGLRVDITCHDQ